MTRHSPPSFFKILLDPSAPHLPLPSNFVSKHLENKILEKVILQSSNGGLSWQLKIKRIDGGYCFADGWINVVKDIQLGYADFLVFRLVDLCTFNFSIFSPNGCEKFLYSRIQVTHVKDGVHEQEEKDDDDVVHENDVDSSDEDEDEDDEYEYNEEEADEEEEDNDDYEDEKHDGGDGDLVVDDGDPFFTKVIGQTHLHVMRLPLEFMRLTGIDGERGITMKGFDDIEWQMRLRLEGCGLYTRYYLSSEWRDFRRHHNLSKGDKCVFKFLRSEDKLCLAKVMKKKVRPDGGDLLPVELARKRAQPPGKHKVTWEDDHVKVVKKPHGSPPGQNRRIVYF